MDFDFGGFIGDVAGELGIGSQEDLAGVVAKNIGAGVARITSSASQQAPNLPIVRPTAYVMEQSGNQEVLGISISADQAKILKFGALAVGAFLLFKLIRRR